jgi:hypothetical protein
MQRTEATHAEAVRVWALDGEIKEWVHTNRARILLFFIRQLLPLHRRRKLRRRRHFTTRTFPVFAFRRCQLFPNAMQMGVWFSSVQWYTAIGIPTVICPGGPNVHAHTTMSHQVHRSKCSEYPRALNAQLTTTMRAARVQGALARRWRGTSRYDRTPESYPHEPATSKKGSSAPALFRQLRTNRHEELASKVVRVGQLAGFTPDLEGTRACEEDERGYSADDHKRQRRS